MAHDVLSEIVARDTSKRIWTTQTARAHRHLLGLQGKLVRSLCERWLASELRQRDDDEKP